MKTAIKLFGLGGVKVCRSKSEGGLGVRNVSLKFRVPLQMVLEMDE